MHPKRPFSNLFPAGAATGRTSLGSPNASRSPIFASVLPMTRDPPMLEPRLRVLESGHAAFGPGKAELLRRIAETGSIRAAAARMSMSYNRAWGLVRDMNRHFRKPLVAAVRGGDSGGGAVLTPAGADVLGRYTRMETACLSATRLDWRALRRLLR